MLFGLSWDADHGHWLFAWSILPILLRGLLVTLQATIAGFAIAAVLGLLFAMLKAAPWRLVAWPARLISEFLRDTPLLVQLFFLYYVLPDFGIVLPAFLTGALALGLQYSAYLSEVYRAGLQAVSLGQTQAALALGLKPIAGFRYVILPQALKRILPALGNYLISISKDVPLLGVVAILELLNVARIIGDRTYDYFTPLTMAGLIYLILSLACAALVRCLEQRPQPPRA
ncbi:ectoine/hydroxyectoine ABC transporter permease subunit EhuD [Pusillimonas sp. CC-YST705]|uniref:Ectoine/hydroxyectoine ABC transporter permease subunit EhuD n=1 Tax=Mesopusillimonas faecipullorum TaxID=2755040 RepID=A0ABS8CAI0_9BURK|nr:ectoine/hydroxyectoine ABC transporter permease subunit EhuD [Mesopusillimonas faecipullorum]MCB5362867.1 ectoine/hydroxyectoine ABC transporter permease subunit EhuD [Mesopusillimonas faecipullorum]